VNSDPTKPLTLADVRDRPLVRLLVTACQATGLLLTWPLWQVRSGATTPPNLPLFDAALLDRLQVPFGESLLLTLVVALIWPRIGSVAHVALLVAALGFDQLRIQPEFVSLAILLLGTLPRRGPLLLARGHLIALWFWAGLHKLLSPEYLQTTGPDLVHGLLSGATDRQAMILGIGTALVELSLGLAAVFPATRRGVPLLAAHLHGIVLLTLVARGWNTAVWPWNLALVVAGYGFFHGWTGPLWTWESAAGPPIESASARSAAIPSSSPIFRWLWQSAAVAVVAYPALFYLNLCDGYLAWCVYSSNVPDAVIYDSDSPEGERLFDRAYEPLNVPFSPATRLFEQYLRRVGRMGDRLEIDDPRPLSRWGGFGQRRLRFTSDGPVQVQP
jgi:hypothetical protein